MAKERLYFLDWLRSLTIALLVPAHTAHFFYLYWFHIKNVERSLAATVFLHFIVIWYLPLLFLLAGASTGFAMQKLPGWWSYIRERLLRLLMPLVFGTLVFVAPQVYLERLYKKQFSGSYFDFFPRFFHGIYPQGNFSWHHLWFFAYLLAFSLASIPLLAYFRRESGQKFLSRVATWGSSGRNIFLLAIPVVLSEVILRVKYPLGNYGFVNDWATLLTYSTTYIYGYILFSRGEWLESIEKQKKTALLLTMAGCAILFGVEISVGRPEWRYSLVNLLYIAVDAFTTWNIVLTFLGYGRTYLNFQNRILVYIGEASLPYYIIHEFFVILFGYYILPQPWSIATKFCVIVLLAYSTTLLCYEVCVRRIPRMRFCLGMRPRS
jgi:peptidoglycan/LPS O-acetylase OafA/YrhL